ncbi:hypothetical protein P885DRAFT_38127 [Corynascus similis CBS 632.67]
MANAMRPSGVVPAQLGFLAIYNPSLGTTDETIDDQIVYYASASTLSSGRHRRLRATKDGRPTDTVSSEERNERLRQIGLAQGMVEFAKSFSGGKAVDSIDTERTRVVLHELEPGWWILASIDLTRLPLPASKTPTTPPTPSPSPSATKAKSTAPHQSSSSSPLPSPQYEYSAREVKPPCLLLRDLARAHDLFLLHHGGDGAGASSLTELATTLPRPRLVAALAHYWDAFLPTWNVLLHGNPARAVLGGIKVAACGELGIGVGEEERGSGEREVLEGLVSAAQAGGGGGGAGMGMAGLIDLVVGRFGDAAGAPPLEKKKKGEGAGRGGKAAGDDGGDGSVSRGGHDDSGWLGLGEEVGAEDGAVFLGVGALSRRSLRTVTDWMEDVYTWGESAYGVADGATGAKSSRAKKRRGNKKYRGGATRVTSSAGDDNSKAQTTEGSGPRNSESGGGVNTTDQTVLPNSSSNTGDAGAGMDKMFSYLKLGYGTYWSLGTSSPATNSDVDGDSAADLAAAEEDSSQKSSEALSAGYFLLGLEEQKAETVQTASSEQDKTESPRTLTVELEPQPLRGQTVGSTSSPDPNAQNSKRPRTAQVRPVIYVHRPFIYILLFDPASTISTSWAEHSQLLHAQLGTLHKPLLSSTAYRPEKPNLGLPASLQSEIYDLVIDPQSLTIHSTIPNIPDPVFVVDSSSASAGILTSPPKSTATKPAPWTRVEALNTHIQILSMFAGSRGDPAASERTCKTSRGWWVVWSRVLEQPSPGGAAAADESGRSLSPENSDSDAGSERGADANGVKQRCGGVCRDIFLVRRASDQGGGGIRAISGASYVGGGGSSAGWADGASRLAQGIGVDTRRYIEGLLSLSR